MIVTDSLHRREETASERYIGFGVAICLCVAVAVTLVVGAFGRAAKPLLPSPGERINPNTAAVPSLVRLPGIGASKARAIVLYREQYLAATGEATAFHRPGDLTRIHGIGPKTAETISVWLDFGQSTVAAESPLPTPVD
jgi:competence ComEA-like helix-hairpin-helix protein